MSDDVDKRLNDHEGRIAVVEKLTSVHTEQLRAGAVSMATDREERKNMQRQQEEERQALRQELHDWGTRTVSDTKESNLRVEKTLENHTVDDKAALANVASAIELWKPKPFPNWLRAAIVFFGISGLGILGGAIWWLRGRDSQIQEISTKQDDQTKAVEQIKNSAARQESAQSAVQGKLDLVIRLLPGKTGP